MINDTAGIFIIISTDTNSVNSSTINSVITYDDLVLFPADTLKSDSHLLKKVYFICLMKAL